MRWRVGFIDCIARLRDRSCTWQRLATMEDSFRQNAGSVIKRTESVTSDLIISLMFWMRCGRS